MRGNKLSVHLVLGVHEIVVGCLNGTDSFIQVQVHGKSVSVLRVLDPVDQHIPGERTCPARHVHPGENGAEFRRVYREVR